MSNEEIELPIVCERRESPAAEQLRQRELWMKLADALLEKRELDNGYALRLPGEMFEQACETMAIERRCCGFLSIRLEVVGGSSDLWLSLEGPPGTKQVLDSELALILGGRNL